VIALRRLLVPLVVGFVFAWPANAGAHSAAAPCKPGPKTVGSFYETIYCGPAKATLKVSSTTLNFSPGECVTTAKSVSVLIGTAVITTNPADIEKLPHPPLFSITVGRSGATPTAQPAPTDGTYTKATLVAIHGAANDYSDEMVTVTLTHNRTAGSFSGSAAFGKSLSGTFTC
jgi:hypothetical protein